VPEYDAFGREVGEDSLAQWRQGSAAPPPRPAPAATVTAGDPLAPVSPPPRTARLRAPSPELQRRRRRRGTRIGILLVLGWVTFNLIGGLVDKVEDAARSIDIPNLSSPEPAKAPTGLAAGSLLRPAAFERAMAEIRRHDIGRIQSLRVAPEDILPTLLTPKGTLVVVQVTHGGEFKRFSESGAGFGGLETIPYDRIDPLVPQRLTRLAAERLGKPVSKIDYVLPNISQGEVSWGAYFKDGEIFMADGHGRHLRRIS
jgi:hypothetical protein